MKFDIRYYISEHKKAVITVYKNSTPYKMNDRKYLKKVYGIKVIAETDEWVVVKGKRLNINRWLEEYYDDDYISSSWYFGCVSDPVHTN